MYVACLNSREKRPRDYFCPKAGMNMHDMIALPTETGDGRWCVAFCQLLLSINLRLLLSISLQLLVCVASCLPGRAAPCAG